MRPDADAAAEGTRKDYMQSVATVPLLVLDDFGMRKLPHTAAEDLLEIVMRRYERFSTLLTSNRPVEDWGKLLGDVAAVSSMLDRLLHLVRDPLRVDVEGPAIAELVADRDRFHRQRLPQGLLAVLGGAGVAATAR